MKSMTLGSEKMVLGGVYSADIQRIILGGRDYRSASGGKIFHEKEALREEHSLYSVFCHDYNHCLSVFDLYRELPPFFCFQQHLFCLH